MAMASTSFKVSFNGTYIHVQLDPGFEISPETMTRIYAEVAEASRLYNCRNVYSEGIMPSRRMNMAAAFVSGDQVSHTVAGMRMACYFKGYHADELTDFFKTVARNRGTMVEFFTTQEEAFRWLGVQPPGEEPERQPDNGNVTQYLL